MLVVPTRSPVRKAFFQGYRVYDRELDLRPRELIFREIHMHYTPVSFDDANL